MQTHGQPCMHDYTHSLSLPLSLSHSNTHTHTLAAPSPSGELTVRTERKSRTTEIREMKRRGCSLMVFETPILDLLGAFCPVTLKVTFFFFFFFTNF